MVYKFSFETFFIDRMFMAGRGRLRPVLVVIKTTGFLIRQIARSSYSLSKQKLPQMNQIRA